MLRLYMGAGAGKTTAAAGLALRAVSHGKRVRVLQLLKPAISPEFAALQDRFGVPVTLAHPNMPFFFQLSTKPGKRITPPARRESSRSSSRRRQGIFC